MYVFHARNGLRAVRLIISGPCKGEKNGTAQRPSLPEMNEFLVGRVAEARAAFSSTLVHNYLNVCGFPQALPLLAPEKPLVTRESNFDAMIKSLR
jgi:hypothetical protein